jgi:isoleucyl-tRNA synthetase
MTLDHEFEVNQLGVFLKAFEKGLVYQDLKPIYWSWSSQTALADAEIEYADVKSPSIYTTFEVIENKGKIKAKDRLLI